MRASLTFSRIALILTGLWIAMGVPAGIIAAEPTSASPQVTIAQPSAPANLMNYTEYYETADAKEPVKTEPTPAVDVNICGQGCGASSCDPGCAHWILNVEAVWLSPQQQRRASADYTIAGGGTSYGDFDGGLASGLFITPGITLGYQGECWGLQTRYWRMNESKNSVIPGSGLDTFGTETACGVFKAETVDLEATRMVCWGETTNQVSFGVRYAQLDQSTQSSASRLLGGPLASGGASFSGSSFARNEFSGTGLTLGLTGTKPLNCRCFKLYYCVRGSVVWDNNSLSEVETQSIVRTSAANAGTDNGALAIGRGSMFIGELQVGPQWDFELCNHRAKAFVRLALEYQYWNTQDTGGAASISDAFAIGGSRVDGIATARAGDARTDLFGFTVATGFTW